MSVMVTYEQVASLASQLSPDDQRRLANQLLSENLPPVTPKRCWTEIRGIAPNLLGGEDAQQWVTRNRQEDQAHRDKILGSRS